MEIRSLCLSIAINFILWDITLYPTNHNITLLVFEWKATAASKEREAPDFNVMPQ